MIAHVLGDTVTRTGDPGGSHSALAAMGIWGGNQQRDKPPGFISISSPLSMPLKLNKHNFLEFDLDVFFYDLFELCMIWLRDETAQM